ncbi:MAG: hypothetical protein IJO69_03045 [Ruminiclostridium sp.]|nr:hypothetical protein [Ruminiclostridium sp.]MBQ9932794.1 hypothetical protein [Ruminiclostridium sp.]
MKRKLFSILTILLLLFTLAACQQEEAPAPQEDTAQSETLTQEEQAEFLGRLTEVYAPAAEFFGLTDVDYVWFLLTGEHSKNSLTTEEYLGLSGYLHQEEGDTLPVGIWEDAQTLHTLDLDKDGTFTHRTFQRAEDPDLTHSDFRNLWVETAEAETWTPD